MRKCTTFFLVLVAVLISASDAKSQKIGYISTQELINAMPEFKNADTALAEYQDALNQEYAGMVGDFNKKDSLLSSRDTLKYTKAQLELMRRQQQELYQKVQGWQKQAQQLYQQKQQQLLSPVYDKARKAIQDVSKENGYAYVFSKEQLLAFPAADDILPLVKKKLGLK